MDKLNIISWNLTRRCHLRCPHCYIDGGQSGADGELTTAEGRRLINDMAALNPHLLLIITGGEPLLRSDIFELASLASSKGLTVVVGSNGPGADYGVALELLKSGVKGVGVSLDSAWPDYHDRFRGVEGSWREAMDWIEACKRAGLRFHIQMSVSKDNFSQLSAMIDLAKRLGAMALNLFTFVCTGRAASLPCDNAEHLEAMLSAAADAAFKEPDLLVRAKCAPQFKRIIHQKNGRALALARNDTFSGAGCLAGISYLRITPEADVTPCPYIEMSAGSLKRKTLSQIWESSSLLRKLRGNRLLGRCGACEFAQVCGGCRAKALSAHGDIMAEDPSCPYSPGEQPPETKGDENRANSKPAWSEDALARMERVPHFLREMVAAKIEQFAMSLGATTITPKIMEGARRWGGPQ